jgi:hypothetical protein
MYKKSKTQYTILDFRCKLGYNKDQAEASSNIG